MDENKCTHDCSTCGAVCDDNMPKEKDIFQKMEDMTSALHEDAGVEMLEKLAAELDLEE